MPIIRKGVSSPPPPPTTPPSSPSPLPTVAFDDREGSGNLPSYAGMGWCIPILTRLEFGDIAWEAEGPDGTRARIGIEYKTISDLLGSMDTGRLTGHQIPGMIRTYTNPYLLVGGSWQSRGGILYQESAPNHWTEPHGNRRTASSFIAELTTIATLCGVQILWARTEEDVSTTLRGLHSWWAKGWANHKSHLRVYTPPPDTTMFRKPGIVRRVAVQFHGVGWELAGRIASHFPTVRSFVNASESELRKVEGVGLEKAKGIVASCCGFKEDENE